MHVAVPAVVQVEPPLGAAELAILTHRNTPQQRVTTDPAGRTNKRHNQPVCWQSCVQAQL